MKNYYLFLFVFPYLKYQQGGHNILKEDNALKENNV